jgi:putative heme degradation protein
MQEAALYSPELPRPAPVAGPSPRPAALSAIIGRIEEAIEVETAAIRGDPDFDIKASNARKSRQLYELNRAMKGLSQAEILGEHREALTRLRGKLADNEKVLRAHLSAVGEVAALIRDAIQKAETDGTYSAQEFGTGRTA